MPAEAACHCFDSKATALNQATRAALPPAAGGGRPSAHVLRGVRRMPARLPPALRCAMPARGDDAAGASAAASSLVFPVCSLCDLGWLDWAAGTWR